MIISVDTNAARNFVPSGEATANAVPNGASFTPTEGRHSSVLLVRIDGEEGNPETIRAVPAEHIDRDGATSFVLLVDGATKVVMNKCPKLEW